MASSLVSQVEQLIARWRQDNGALHRKYTDAGVRALRCADELTEVCRAWQAEQGTERKHGVDCPKAKHIGLGYLHSEDDDRPYDVDGVVYCGRCHGWMESLVLAPAATEE